MARIIFFWPLIGNCFQPVTADETSRDLTMVACYKIPIRRTAAYAGMTPIHVIPAHEPGSCNGGALLRFRYVNLAYEGGRLRGGPTYRNDARFYENNPSTY